MRYAILLYIYFSFRFALVRLMAISSSSSNYSSSMSFLAPDSPKILNTVNKYLLFCSTYVCGNRA